MAEELADSMRTWYASTGSKGVFEEPGVLSISPEIRYLGRDAVFEIDASGSGQETLNTVYLAILSLCIARRFPLALIDLSAAPDLKALGSKFTARLM